MLVASLILLLVAVSGAHSACNCYTTNSSTVTGKKISISNAYNDADFSACYSGTCGFIANSGVATMGWSSFTATFTTQDPSGKFTIYDGLDDNPNNAIIATYAVSDSGKNISLTSSTPSIFVKYSQDDPTKPNQYFGNLMSGSPLAAPTTTAAPTSAPTTRAFNDPTYAKDPHFISHDLLILVNQKTTQGLTGLTAINELATNFVKLLSVTSSATGTSQTRLGLATVTPYTPNYAAQGEIWTMNAADVTAGLPKAGVSSNVNIINALTGAVPAFFNVADTVAPTRSGVQRSVLLFTAWWDDAQLLDSTVQNVFKQYGVNLAVVGYGTTSPSLKTNDWYNYASLTNTSVNDVASFVNRFYLNSNLNNNLANNWCKKGSDPSVVMPSITEPSDYAGPSGSSTWGSSNGQTARYCNFQDTTYTYYRADSAKNVSVTVFYELEVENDYLKFFADGIEVESFTGNDVNNANFVVNATVITARFTTDSAGVERGFSATFAEI